MKPLSNITVLECGTGLTAPYTSSLLGDLRANVIKIEGPEGDASRSWPPVKEGFSYYYAILNRNKRNVIINLKIIYCHISGFGWDSPYRNRSCLRLHNAGGGWMDEFYWNP